MAYCHGPMRMQPHPTRRALIFLMLPSSLSAMVITHLTFMTCIPGSLLTTVANLLATLPAISSSMFERIRSQYGEAIASATEAILRTFDDSSPTCFADSVPTSSISRSASGRESDVPIALV